MLRIRQLGQSEVQVQVEPQLTSTSTLSKIVIGVLVAAAVIEVTSLFVKAKIVTSLAKKLEGVVDQIASKFTGNAKG